MSTDFTAMHGLYLEDLKVGMSAMFGKTVTEADIAAFAGVSGDTNPIHLHDGFAHTTRFGQRIAHGMLSGSFISTVVGTKLPGPGAIYVSQTLNFMASVSIGDTLTAVCTITDINQERRRVTLKTQYLSGDTVVIDGEAIVSAHAEMIPSFDDWQATPDQWKGGAVALGNFDGVHRGHRALLDRTAEHAKALGAPVVALTFEPHPRGFFVPDTGPFRLTMPPAKLRLLEQYGVQAVLEQHFDQAFAALSPDAFVDDVLLKGLGARRVVCGYDFTFGARRGGNVERLREKGREKGLGVTMLDPVTHEGEIYSSTRIREALRAGWVSEAAELLAHEWEIEGVVELGDQRGRTIGFPTANVALGEHLRPRFGVYAVRALVDGKWRDAVANLGRRPTFGKLKENFEVHLFDFSGDLYGKTLRVVLVDFIRSEMKFTGLDQLKTQIAADGEAARKILDGEK